MKVSKLNESGYEQAAQGFSLSYNSTIERAKQILPKYAFGISGERKFLESIVVWLDIMAPRYWWQEADTYRVGITKQSESTMHTLTKQTINQMSFEDPISHDTIDALNRLISYYRIAVGEVKQQAFLSIKSLLPEGFLQRRIVMVSYKTLQNMYDQRHNHRLPQWQTFLNTVLQEIEHPEFIVKGES